jgi:hypothetical protein
LSSWPIHVMVPFAIYFEKDRIMLEIFKCIIII